MCPQITPTASCLRTLIPFGARDAGLGSLDLLVLFVFLFWQHIQEASGKKGFQLKKSIRLA